MELPLRLTALTLLLRPMGPWGLRAMILGLAALALVTPRVLLSPVTWGALAAFIGWRIAWDWPLADNHIYLLAYWCLAIALSLGHPDARLVLSDSAALLLAVAFVMAVLWKAVLSPDFLDGRFFRVTLLTDQRFTPLITYAGGLSGADIERNREILTPLPEGAELIDPPALIEPPPFRRLVQASTAGILALETSIAVACLAVVAGARSLAAHTLLLLFCAVTYAFAPVAGFGWLLLSVGAAFTRPHQRTMRAAYVAIWLLVLVYAELRV